MIPNTSVTDANCRFHHVTNAYVVGPALFPDYRIAEPNAHRHRARAPARRSLDAGASSGTPEPGFTYLFDGTDAQFANWQMAGGGFLSRFGRT